MLRTQRELRILGPADVRELTALAARSPVVNAFADYRARSTQLVPRSLAGEVWGYHEDGELVSACHSGANLVPIEATVPAIDAFAGAAVRQGRRCSTIVGPSESVAALWARLEPHWSPAREVRWDQPHLEARGNPAVAPDPGVRRTTLEDLPALYPACVDMYTEEVGISPEAGGASGMYRARISQLVSRGWSFARIEDGQVVFKAEIAMVTPHACQVQGVYVAPERRGEGISVGGMAAVVDLAVRGMAPVVSLYVNAHNHAARRAYEHVGFRQTAVFSTVMF